MFILAATGLLDGETATTRWRCTDLFQHAFPAIDVQPDVLYIDNGGTLTSAGSAAGLDLGLHLIRRDFGAEAANQVARRLVIAPHRDGGQAQFITHPVRNENQTSLAATTNWAIEHLDQPVTVAELAAHANMTPEPSLEDSAANLVYRLTSDSPTNGYTSPSNSWKQRQNRST